MSPEKGFSRPCWKIIEGPWPVFSQWRPQASATGIVKVDTTNILFIFAEGPLMDWKRSVQSRSGAKVMGFGADIRKQSEKNDREILDEVQNPGSPRFGLIPEFIGRLPVIATWMNWVKKAMVRILTEPQKWPLSGQYQKLFEIRGVDLKFTDEPSRRSPWSPKKGNPEPEGYVPYWKRPVGHYVWDPLRKTCGMWWSAKRLSSIWIPHPSFWKSGRSAWETGPNWSPLHQNMRETPARGVQEDFPHRGAVPLSGFQARNMSIVWNSLAVQVKSGWLKGRKIQTKVNLY